MARGGRPHKGASRRRGRFLLRGGCGEFALGARGAVDVLGGARLECLAAEELLRACRGVAGQAVAVGGVVRVRDDGAVAGEDAGDGGSWGVS